MAAPIDQAFQIAVRHHQAGRLSQAQLLYRDILSKQPDHADALHFLGVIAAQAGQHETAVNLIGRAIGLKPDDPDALYNLGKALTAAGNLDDAIAAYRRAIVLDPGSSEIHNNLGVALQAHGRLDEAVEAFRRAAGLRSSTPEAYNNLGSALGAAGKLDDAIKAYRRAIALRPGYAEAHTNLALALLAQGEFESGWDEYEWRWKCGHLTPDRRAFAQPLWDGGPLAGATILLRAEQGLGDTIQFIRYLPLVAQRGGKIVVECQKELRRLIQIQRSDATVVVRGDPLPAFDLHCPFMSLPRVLRTTLATIPGRAPYLHADVEMTARWEERLANESNSLKVGLAWAGSKANTRDRDRSIALSSLAPFARLRGIRFYSLRKVSPLVRSATHRRIWQWPIGRRS